MAAIRKSAVAQPASSESAAKQARLVGRKKTIDAVLKEVKVEFPDITLSKICFLESEGLLCPSRSSSGHRRYSRTDIDRLRYIFTVQRDNYLSPKVIKEQPDEIDVNNVGGDGLASVTPPMMADQFREAAVVSLAQAELAERIGASEKFITELAQVGLITPDTLNMFDGDDLLVTETAVKLAELGPDARHLRTACTATACEADLVSLAASPLSKSRTVSGEQKAVEMGREMTVLMVMLYGTLVKRQANKDLGKQSAVSRKQRLTTIIVVMDKKLVEAKFPDWMAHPPEGDPALLLHIEETNRIIPIQTDLATATEYSIRETGAT